MKKTLLLFFVLISYSTFSQIRFEPGYITENNGTRKECLIRNVAWKNNPIEIEYKITENDVTQKATIAQLIEFSVGNAYKYKRFTTKIDRSSANINNLSNEKAPVFKEETLFLKLLVEGKTNLYQYEDNNLIRYFISSDNHETAEQLIYKEYSIGSSAVAKNNQFRQQLYMALKSDKLGIRDFEKVNYNQNELTKLFILYNTTENNAFTNLDEKQNKSSVNIKLVAGINSAKLNIKSGLSNNEVKFDNVNLFKVGAEIEYRMGFNQNKWSLFFDPNYQAYKSDAPFLKTNIRLRADYKMLELPVGVRHHFYLNDKSRIFVDLGYAFAIAFNSTVDYSYQKLQIANSGNVFFGAGFAYDRYAIEMRYSPNREILDNYLSWKSKYSSLSVAVSYRVF